MTERNGWRGLRAAAATAVALVLAGCAADYVGDDWQCPLAQGSVCASVAAADPAVPEALEPDIHAPRILVPGVGDSGGLPGGAPPYRPRKAGDAEGTEANGEAGCESECSPLAWLAGLFDGLAGDDGSPQISAAGQGDDEGIGQGVDDPVFAAATDAPASGVLGSAATQTAVADRSDVPTPLPAVDAAPAADAAPLPTHDDVPQESVRAPETVGRIWIAPWIDAEGIYREGAWVRAVIAPAEWRLR